jgi:putative tricarboxylic transport membrane protein
MEAAHAVTSPAAVRNQSLIGVAVLLLGALLAAGAWFIPSAAGYAGVGPNFLPWVVAAALGLCGLMLIVHARSGGWRQMEGIPGGEDADWPALAWVCAGVTVNAALITTVGFILSCTLCFMLAVRGLQAAEGKPHGGARGLLIDAVTGFLIATPAFWLFTKVLSINLPGLTATGWI